TIPPTVTITNMGSLLTLTRATTLGVEFTSASSVSFLCSMDNGISSSCSSPAQFNGIVEGSHQIAIYGIDAAGNISTSPATFQWVVDLTPPAANFVQVTPPETLSNAVTKAFTFSASETALFECSTDQAGFTPCTSPWTL